MTQPVRTPWQVTRSVWYALFIREALSRTTADRFAWFWMIAEPAAMIILMVLIRSLIMGSSHHVSGAEFIPWFVVGLFGFYLYRDNMMKLMGAIGSNKALFTYRQVKPIDPVIVRSYVETLLRTLIFILFLTVSQGVGIDLLPDSFLKSIYMWCLLWGLGLGSGLIVSSLSVVFPEVGKIVKIISFPLLLISCVLFPINLVPHSLRELVLINPVVHGVELLRLSFFHEYHIVDGVSIIYFQFWVMFSLLLGFLLHLKYENKLKAQ
jgi:capsular polysaccharide transport system permease protein